jgi:signal transduction histidine kinase
MPGGGVVPGYDGAGVMNWRSLPTYPWIVKRMPGSPLAPTSARWRPRTAVQRAWHGLIQVLTGPEPPPVWRWRSAEERHIAYAVLGAVTLVLCAANLVGSFAAWGQLLVALPAVAPLPLAARYPMLAWRIGWLALLLAPLVPAVWWGGWPWGPGQILAMLGVFFLAGIRQPRVELWWMWALSLIPWCLWLIADIPNLHGPASSVIVFTAAVIAVESIGSRLHAQQFLATQTERAEAERARRAVLEERTRIARELHDVVAHHMSLIAVRAETAPYRLTGLSESAKAEFSSLSEVAREALGEMRRLLGVLRHDQPAALAPQPQLSDLPALVDAARQAGAPVEFSAPTALGQVPAGVGVCAYRIVQESLSNASQHAPGAPITVSIDAGRGAVLLRVANGPGGHPAPHGTEHRPGHGLTGMYERVALLGGSLTAGPEPGGGFVVSAVLPLGETS